MTVHISNSSVFADITFYIKRGSCGYADKTVHISSSSVFADKIVHISNSSVFADKELCIPDNISAENAVAAAVVLGL